MQRRLLTGLVGLVISLRNHFGTQLPVTEIITLKLEGTLHAYQKAHHYNPNSHITSSSIQPAQDYPATPIGFAIASTLSAFVPF